MGRNRGFCLLAVSAAVLLVPLQADSETGDLFIDTVGSVFLAQDAASVRYEGALDQVKAYIEEDTAENMALAEEALQNEIEYFVGCIEDYENPDISAELEKELEENGLLAEDYRALCDTGLEDINQYIQYLGYLQEYLEMEKETDIVHDDFVFLYECDVRLQDLSRRFGCVSVNYFFAELEEEQLEYLQDTVLADLESFSFDDIGWSSDRSELELKLEVYLSQIENQLTDIAVNIGAGMEAIYDR